MRVLELTLGCLILYILYSLYIRREPFLVFDQSSLDKIELIDLETMQGFFPTADFRMPPSNCVIFSKMKNHYYLYSQSIGKNESDINSKAHLDALIQYVLPNVKLQNFYMIICFYDGYGERTEYKHTPVTFQLVPKKEYEGKEEIEVKPDQFPRWPLFHSKQRVYVFSKRINDSLNILIPDTYFMTQKGYAKLLKEIDATPIEWNTKQAMCVWRGKLENGTYHNFKEKQVSNLNQRERFVELYRSGKFTRMTWDESYMSIEEQRRYKYILDIDGFTNTWDATVWKLYSGSVLLKVDSIWEQWYYKKLIPWKHYVPVANDFSDLNAKLQWCIDHDEECKEITKNAREFVREELNWEKVIRDYADTITLYSADS